MRKRIHSLKRPKVRADWSKWNLYNLSRMTVPFASNKTFFQQKWLAKSMTRAFHGNQIREGQWERMFDRRLPGVVPMDYRLLARTDGSDQAAGRGSGLQKRPGQRPDPPARDPRGGEDGEARRAREESDVPKTTPYMQMTYWPTERRLDSAIWRSLFASSVKQARQFVVHGFVKVNGKPMQYPGYLLNPGDMFQVDPDRVLFATGARKFSKNSPETAQGRSAVTREMIIENDEEDLAEEAEEEVEEEEAEEEEDVETSESPEQAEDPKQALKSLMARARQITSDPKANFSAKRKQDLREFAKTAKRTLSKLGGKKQTPGQVPVEETIEGLEEGLNAIIAKIAAAAPATETAPAEASTSTGSSEEGQNPSQPQSTNKYRQDPNFVDNYNARRDAEILHRALQRAQENPIDVRKSYATPWQPREFMSAFAFIPRYLEVNQNICSAVYLRHPVARPGLAEVPTPFGQETGELAHNWYLRRR
ncbi:hypothetical protein MBLNU457_g0544t1 [Dothideomycetes sp. NU457]